MNKKYALEIYKPGSIEDVEVTFESDTPFLNINIGDILNTNMWSGTETNGKLIKVVKMEHFIWEYDSGPKHKIGIITKEIEDTLEERFSR